MVISRHMIFNNKEAVKVSVNDMISAGVQCNSIEGNKIVRDKEILMR